jgi:hypothetical protein
MTDREFIKKIEKELIGNYQFLDEEYQKAFDMGELLGMVKLYLEMQQGEGNGQSEFCAGNRRD